MFGKRKYSDQESIVWEVLEENVRNRRGDLRPQVPESQKSRLEIPKFVRKDDGMGVLIKICELSYEKEGESGTFVPLPSDATKQANLSVPRSNGVFPKLASSLASSEQVSESTSTRHTTGSLDEISRAAYLHKHLQILMSRNVMRINLLHKVQEIIWNDLSKGGEISIVVVILHLLQKSIQFLEVEVLYSFSKFSLYLLNNNTVKITHPEIHEELKFDSNGERSAWFSKTLCIDDHKSVNCDDEQSVLIVDTMAFDPRDVNYDNPFVLTVATMVIDTRICDLRVPTLGTMGCVNFGGFLKVTGCYGSRGCSVVFSNIQIAGEIRDIFGICEQYQVGFMLEDIGIFDDRGNSDVDINAHWDFKNKAMIVNFFPTLPPDRGKGCIMELESTYLDQFEACDMGCFHGVCADEPLDIETELVLDSIVGGGIENKLVQPQFNVSLKSVVEHDEKLVGDLTMSTLKMLVDEGVKVLQRNLFTNDVFYKEIVFDMHSLRLDILPLVPLFCQSLLGDQFVVNPKGKQVEESKFDLLLVGTTNAILLIEGYNDFMTKELLLQAVDIRVLTALIELEYIKEDGFIKSDEVVEMDEDEEDELMVVDGEIEQGWKKK
eukprot:Gb_16183 [translate_table: standard]